MHRVILDAPAGMMCDHIDMNGLNNQRGNLRFATHSQNSCNRKHPGGLSPFKGVFPRNEKWRAYIKTNQKMIHLGTFDTERDAAIAYNTAAIQYHGEFARLNTV